MTDPDAPRKSTRDNTQFLLYIPEECQCTTREAWLEKNGDDVEQREPYWAWVR